MTRGGRYREKQNERRQVEGHKERYESKHKRMKIIL